MCQLLNLRVPLPGTAVKVRDEGRNFAYPETPQEIGVLRIAYLEKRLEHC